MSVKNVLIVVDVQNCFIQGGSLGDLNPESIKLNIDQANIISKLVTDGRNNIKYNDIVFTRDFHPEYHTSLYNEIIPPSGVYLPHCRNKDRSCDIPYDYGTVYDKVHATKETVAKIIEKNNIITEKNINFGEYASKTVNGTDLSFLFYGTPIAEIVSQLNDPGNHTIGLQDGEFYKGEPNIEHINTHVTPKTHNQTNIITLLKGEFCDYEAYSAFNYHIKIERGVNIKNKPNEEELKKN